MKNKVQFLKKGFNNICQKLKVGNNNNNNNNKQKSSPKHESDNCDYYSIGSIQQRQETNSSSSGYTSATDEYCILNQKKHQQESIAVNINETQCDVTTANQNQISSTSKNLIKYLLDYETLYIDSIQNGLENYIRPLMAIMNNKLYFQIFQNIEKIYSMSQFIRNKIMEYVELSGDFVQSTIDVIYEFVSFYFFVLILQF
jgi:hypothetical protein